MRTILAATSLLFISAAAVPASTDVPLKPGNYVITYRMEMNGESAGAPGKAGPRCLKPADMGDPESVFSQNSYNAMGRNPQCKVTNLSSAGGKFAYDLVCPRSTDHIDASVAGDAFKVTRSAKGRTSATVSVVTRVEGKRVGDCRN